VRGRRVEPAHVPGPVFLGSERLSLRTIEREDVASLQSNANRPGVRGYARGDVPYNRPRYERERFDPLAEGEYVGLLVCAGDERVGNV